MESIEIREAQLEDLETLKSFEQAIIKFERPFAPNLGEDPISYYDLAELINREDAYVIVAVEHKKIVASGYALIKQSKPYLKSDRHAYLGFMYVLPNYRGQGMNGRIVDELIQWSKNQNIKEIQLEVYAENEIALNAYTKKNFKPDLLRMVLNLEE
jgi:ribosomal protein S18 acetylase RimI-like enzyme